MLAAANSSLKGGMRSKGGGSVLPRGDSCVHGHFDFNLLSAVLLRELASAQMSVSSNSRKAVSRTVNAGAIPVTDSMARCHVTKSVSSSS